MDFQNGSAITSTALNALARRQNGIRNLEPTHNWDEGPCAVTVGSGQNAVELDVSGGTAQVDGTELTVQSTQVTPSDNTTEDEYRQDIVYVAESGEVSVLAGETAENPHGVIRDGGGGEAEAQWAYPGDVGMAVPEPVSTHTLAGTVLARVIVPPGATESNDISPSQIQDLRLPAIRERLDPWQNPTSVFGPASLNVGDDRAWATTVRPGEAFELYALSQNHSLSDWDPAWGIETALINSTDGVTASSAEEVWSNDGGYLRGDPIERIEVPTGASERDIGFIQRHEGDADMADDESITLSAAYRILPL